ncbi:MAG: sodium:calcium antiporter [Rhodobacteraceae bacterium]|nr:sodium:calcium antiporter [Paracoccaceae bacterium]MCP5341890.1 sodium:calcium antiporter [Paracoccaceae bacterium]
MTYLLFVLGLVGLSVGGEFLVRGAVHVARRLHVPALVIGATVVGFGTSVPELLVSVQAAMSGAPDLALGNVIGSNIANILLILGVAALIFPVPLRVAELRLEFMVMIGSTAMLWILLLGNKVTRWEGAMMFAALIAYLYFSLRTSAGSAPPEPSEPEAMPLWRSAGCALGGLVILMVGARFLVDSSTDIARTFGVSEAVIGLTIVAIGTSLPELAASIMAALRGHSDIAVGNILGSCIFNVLGILGITAMVTPIPVDPRFAAFDIRVAAVAALVMLGLAFAGRSGRLSGGILLISYAAYLVYLGQG